MNGTLRLGLRTLGAMAFLAAGQVSAAVLTYSTEAAFLAATSGGVLLDFNGSPVQPITGNEFAGSGFIFSPDPALGNSPDARMEIAPPAFFSSSNYLNIGNRPFVCCDSTNDSLNIQIVGNWRAFSLRFVDSQVPGPGEFIDVFDQSNNLILHYTGPANSMPDPGNGYGGDSFFGMSADVNIGRVFVREGSFDGDDVGFDDFRLRNAGQAPEPASLALIAFGLAGLGFSRWKGA